MTTDIIIPSWVFDEDSRALAEGCLENLRGTTHHADVRITLSHSGDLPDNANQADQIIRMDPPQGWAAACNAAFLATESAWIVVGSADIRLSRGWLEEMHLVARARPDTIVSPIDVKRGERRQWDATERGSFWGGFYLFHRSVLAVVGLLDGYGFRHMADMDWGIRAQMAGLRTVRAENVHAEHISPHRSMVKREGDPMNAVVRAKFVERYGTTHLGAWERGREEGAA